MAVGRRALALFTSLVLLALAPTVLAAQGDDTPADQSGAGGIAVFLDCRSGCDGNFIRSEISFVNWVRDRSVADVHVLVSTERTAAGGSQYTLAFLGLRNFRGIGDTLNYATKPAETQDATREQLVQILEVGLVPYLARTPAVANLRIAVAGDAALAQASAARHDPWKSWVLRLSLNSFANGEASDRSGNVRGSLGASRVTSVWKTSVGLSDSYSENVFHLSDGTRYATIQRDYGVSALQVRALGAHWSAGAAATLSSSTYLNERSALRVGPALEYDLFPYAESTRQQLRFQYRVGLAALRYRDTTIFLKLHETLPQHSLSVAYSARQPWGSANVGVYGSRYFRAESKYHALVNGNINLQLVQGLELHVSGNYALIRDQIYLSKGAQTDEDIIAQRQQLATSYRYFYSFGLSYTFGSIFNNIVNPRFGDSGSDIFLAS